MAQEHKNTCLSDPDHELMRRIGSGEAAAFKQLVEKYQWMIMKTIYRYIGNYHEVEDLAQEIFFNVYRAAKRYTPKAKFSTWLYRVVANHCLNYRRTLKRSVLLTSVDNSSPESESPSLQLSQPRDQQPEKLLEQQELHAALKKAISELPDKQRMSLILYRFEGLSYKEIAEVLGCSLSAVESLLFRAMTSFKKKLTP